MSSQLNLTLLRNGYAPAPSVAAVIHKALSTVHRMAEADHIKVTRDGHAVYVDLASLEAHFMNLNNETMVKEVRKLSTKMKQHVDHAEKAAKAAAARLK